MFHFARKASALKICGGVWGSASARTSRSSYFLVPFYDGDVRTFYPLQVLQYLSLSVRLPAISGGCSEIAQILQGSSLSSLRRRAVLTLAAVRWYKQSSRHWSTQAGKHGKQWQFVPVQRLVHQFVPIPLYEVSKTDPVLRLRAPDAKLLNSLFSKEATEARAIKFDCGALTPPWCY